jgi:hypothetical protein
MSGLILYKGKECTVLEACEQLKINHDEFMAWCKKLALQNYGYALNYYKRKLKHQNKKA